MRTTTTSPARTGDPVDIEDVMLSLTAPAVGAVLVVGFVVGLLFYADRRSQAAYVYTAAMLGLVFTVTMGAVRLATGAPEWERWIGIGALGLIYTTGIAAGSWARRHLAGRHRPGG